MAQWTDGYYWMRLEGQKPEVVEIIGDTMYRCGSAIGCYLDENGKWYEGFFMKKPLNVVYIIGPVILKGIENESCS